MEDDPRWAEQPCNWEGNPDIKTPNMDRIINSGFVFNQAYIQGTMTGATCLPSRAMLMSGKGLFRAPLRLDSGVLMPQVFKKAGYKTFATGKWHNGELSFENCFDEAEAVFFGGAARSHVNVPVHQMIAGLRVPYDAGETGSTDVFAAAAIDFIERQSKTEQPFFCYIPFTAPHSPVTPPGKIVPPQTNTAGRFIRAMAIMQPGIFLSQPPMAT